MANPTYPNPPVITAETLAQLEERMRRRQALGYRHVQVQAAFLEAVLAAARKTVPDA